MTTGMPVDYCEQLPAITLRKIFDQERSPSPSISDITARRTFNFDTQTVTQAVSSGNSTRATDGRHLVVNDRNLAYTDKKGLGNAGPSSVANVIPPPRGPLSKPNGGGYALRDALGWEEGMYRSVQTGLHAVCEKHLDINRPFHNQTPEALMRYFQAACDQYPILNGYQDLWPARDFAKMYLKNKVGQERAKARVVALAVGQTCR